jgi:type II pantothenate kinase
MSAETPQAPQTHKLPLEEVAPPNPATTMSAKPLRMRTNTAEIDNTIIHPGSVKINVKGAFIVDQDSVSPNGSVNGGSHDTKDIRLPNHTAVVSHIAVDVCLLRLSLV